MKKKVLNILCNKDVDNQPYLDFFSKIFDYNIFSLDDLIASPIKINIDFVFFSGGEDVNPSYYGEQKHRRTVYNKSRDSRETSMFEFFGKKIKKIGICRGAQFLNVMSGGKMIQHVENHAGCIHSCEVSEGGIIEVNSTHHQMCYPFNLNENSYEILAWSEYHLSHIYENGNEQNINVPTEFLEPEVILFKDTNSLCIQYHPEMISCPATGVNYAIQKISEFLEI